MRLPTLFGIEKPGRSFSLSLESRRQSCASACSFCGVSWSKSSMKMRKSRPAAAAALAYCSTSLLPELYVLFAPIRPRKSLRWAGGAALPRAAGS
jgi:hypothetical protein